MSVHLSQRDAIDTLMIEKQQAEHRLGEQTRSMFIAMARERNRAGGAER